MPSDLLEIPIVMQKKKIMIEGDLGDEAISGTPHGVPLRFQEKIHPSRGRIRLPTFRPVLRIGIQISPESLKISLGFDALEDFHIDESAKAEGKAAFYDPLQSSNVVSRTPFQKVDQDG